jgi:hypothetical protein
MAFTYGAVSSAQRNVRLGRLLSARCFCGIGRQIRSSTQPNMHGHGSQA